MKRLVSYYGLAWDRRKQAGGISLTFDDRSKVDLPSVRLEELLLFGNILRSEQPVYYDSDSETLTSGSGAPLPGG